MITEDYEKIASKHDLLLSDPLINFADDVTEERMKYVIRQLLLDYSPNELDRLTGLEETTCLKICHEMIVKDYGLTNPKDWKAEQVDENLWGIYGDAWGEWIDESGKFLGFDSKELAEKYINEDIPKCSR
jgi:hypothetical protein